VNENIRKGAEDMRLEFIAVLKLMLKLLELGNIEEAKEVIQELLKEE